MPSTPVPLAIADALVAVAWATLAVDTLMRVRAERGARTALGPVVGTGWHPPRTMQGAVLALTLGGVAALEMLSGRLASSPGCTLLGLALVGAGLWLHVRARRALGPLWSGVIEVRSGHTVIEHGPYARVRHPIYLGVLLLAAGSLLAHPSIATACLAGGLTLGFGLKIRAEERVLRATLGARYEDYAARVPALVPRLGEADLLAAVGNALRRLGARVNPTRQRYALLLGAALWSGWLVSLAAGPGLLDLTGQVKGTDFVEFYAAGRIVLDGAADRLYDLRFQQEVEHALTAPQDWPGLHGFLNPPFFALLFVPFARLPYLWALASWSALGMGLVVASLRVLGSTLPAWRDRWLRPLPWVLAFLPVFAAVSYGQNSLVSVFLLSATFALLRTDRDLAAGLVLGGLLYKPQLVAVLALVLVLDRRWRTVAGLAATAAVLVAVSWAMSAPGARSYVALSRAFPTMLTSAGFPTWNMHSLYGFFTLLLPDDPTAARTFTGLASLLGLIAVRRLQPPYGRDTLPAWFAVALWGSVLVSPHLLLYDLALLAPAALCVWPARRDHELWLGGLAVLWLTLVFSGPLTRTLLAGTGAAVQLSVPVLAAIGYVLLRDACASEPAASGG